MNCVATIERTYPHTHTYKYLAGVIPKKTFFSVIYKSYLTVKPHTVWQLKYFFSFSYIYTTLNYNWTTKTSSIVPVSKINTMCHYISHNYNSFLENLIFLNNKKATFYNWLDSTWVSSLWMWVITSTIYIHLYTFSYVK